MRCLYIDTSCMLRKWVSERAVQVRWFESREQLATCSGRSAVFTNTKRARGVERGCGTAREHVQ